MYPVRVDVVDRALLMGLNVPYGIEGIERLIIGVDISRNRSSASLKVDPDENVVDKVNAALGAVRIALAVVDVVATVGSELVVHLNWNAAQAGARNKAAIDPIAKTPILIVGLGPSSTLRQNKSSSQSGDARSNAKALLVGKLVLLIQFVGKGDQHI